MPRLHGARPTVTRPTGVISAPPAALAQWVEQAPGAVIILSGPAHRITLANAAFRALLGGRDPVGSSFAAAMAGQMASGFVERLDAALRNGQPFNATGQFQVSPAPGLPDERRIFAFRGQPLRDREGGITGIWLEGTDITAQARAEADMRRNLTLLRSIIEATPNVIYAKALDGTMQIANAATLALIGKPWSEVQGRTDAQFLTDPAQSEAVMENDRQVMTTGQTHAVEEWVSTGSAPPRLFLSSKSPVQDEHGEVIGLVGISVDITDRKRAESLALENAAHSRRLNAALEREIAKGNADRERLDLALRASGMIGIWDGDLVAGLVYGDANFSRIYGVDPEGPARGQPLGEYFARIHPDDVAEALAERDRMMAGAEEFSNEHRILRPDGSVIWVIARGRLTRDAQGNPIRFIGVSVDITERKLAEARQAFLVELQDIMRGLREPQAILSAAATHLGRYLGASRIGFGEVQPDDETVRVTCGYVDGVPEVNGLFPLTDFGRHNMALARLGRTIVHTDVLQDPARTVDNWERIGTRAHVTVPLLRDGRYSGSLYVSFNRPHEWARAEITLIEEVANRIWDAAERGHAEARLRESEARLRLALESGGFGSWEYDAASGATHCSARHDEIFGYHSGFPNWRFEDFIAHVLPEDRTFITLGFNATLQGGGDWQAECRIRRADGAQRWIELRARPQPGAGQSERLVGTVADITARKTIEAAAMESAAQFETFAQAMANHVWTARPDGQLDWFNDRVFTYSGLTAEDLAGNGWTCMVHEEDLPGVAAEWGNALATGRLYETEFRLRRADGQFRWHLVRAVAIRADDGRILRWIGTNTDIQDQKITAQALANLNETLQQQVQERTAELMAAEESLRQSQKMEAVGQLTGGIAHDFNNLLTGISGSLELLEARIAQGRIKELDRYLHVAQGAAKRAAALTHRLLAFSRRQTLDPKPTDINRLVADMDELVRRTVGPAITVEVVNAIGLWATLVDPNQLENALLNLCINARDAMPDGGRITIETGNRWLDASFARERDLAPGQYVSLCVSDTGTGMPPEVMERAFDPFFTTKPLGEGTGLGLSMIYGFVRQSGGQARIYSEPGQGTMVCLYLPRFTGQAQEVELPPELTEAHRAAEGETVLIVDDEPSVRLLVREVLEELGYTALEAEDARAGLKILESPRRVNLLITDVGLPGGMNGRQLADAALTTRPGLNVLFITGYAENAVVGDGHLKPGMHIVTKPFALEHLARRIKDILQSA